jgi:arsenite oxidase large subunit
MQQPLMFKSDDGKAKFMATQWRGLQALGKQAEKDKFAFLINNGRVNHTWQSSYLDQTVSGCGAPGYSNSR